MSSFGAALDQMTRDLLPKRGIDPQKDVVLRAIEPTPNRLAALMSGAVDAAVVNQMDRIIAKKNGFNELLFYGDDLEFVTAGAVTTERTSGPATGSRAAISPRHAQGISLAQEQREGSGRPHAADHEGFRS